MVSPYPAFTPLRPPGRSHPSTVLLLLRCSDVRRLQCGDLREALGRTHVRESELKSHPPTYGLTYLHILPHLAGCGGCGGDRRRRRGVAVHHHEILDVFVVLVPFHLVILCALIS